MSLQKSYLKIFRPVLEAKAKSNSKKTKSMMFWIMVLNGLLTMDMDGAKIWKFLKKTEEWSTLIQA